MNARSNSSCCVPRSLQTGAWQLCILCGTLTRTFHLGRLLLARCSAMRLAGVWVLKVAQHSKFSATRFSFFVKTEYLQRGFATNGGFHSLLAAATAIGCALLRMFAIALSHSLRAIAHNVLAQR